eukprot:7412948-Alexandrium_andersonii.AAC.1
MVGNETLLAAIGIPGRLNYCTIIRKGPTCSADIGGGEGVPPALRGASSRSRGSPRGVEPPSP